MMKKTTKMPLLRAAVLTGTLFCIGQNAQAQIPLQSFTMPYTQDFDSLLTTGSGPMNIMGWAINETGSNANQNYTANTGSSNSGDTYSYGAASDPDRALGAIASGSLLSSFGANFINNAGGKIDSMDIMYRGEEWRYGATAIRQDSMIFEYSLDATSLSTGTWTSVVGLNLKTPFTTTTSGALDGNATGNNANIMARITGLAIPNGASFWIRWRDVNISGSDDGLAVDDFALMPYGISLPNLMVNDVSIDEGNVGTAALDFTVKLSAPAGPGGVTFDIATSDGTAASASDYNANSMTAQTIAAGDSVYTFTVIVNGDFMVENDETFNVTVTNIIGANATDTVGVGTIINDDFIPPTVTGDPSDQTVCEGSVATFTASATAMPSYNVQWQVSMDGGANWSDVTGATSDTYTFTAAYADSSNQFRAVYSNGWPGSNGGGADTTTAATLTVIPSYQANLSASVCKGTDVTFPDGNTIVNIQADTVYTSTFTSAVTGCDSLIISTVTVLPTYNVHDTTAVCPGGNVTFADGTTATNVMDTMSHVSSLVTMMGCDSTVTTFVMVYSIDTTYTNASVCAGDSALFNGNYYSAAGTYYVHLSAANTCDSVAALNLTVNALPTVTFDYMNDNMQTYVCTPQSVAYYIYFTEGTPAGGTYSGNSIAGDSVDVNVIATNLPGNMGTYYVTYTYADGNGCVSSVTDSLMVSWCQGIKANNFDASVSVYPNPFTDAVRVEIGANGKSTVKVINALGQVMITKETEGYKSVTINTADIKEGIYFLEITNNGQKSVKRIVKQ